MTRKTKNAPRAGTGLFWKTYILAWMVLAAGALSYLALAASNPRMAQKLLPIATAAAPADPSPSQRRISTDLKALHSAVVQLDEKVADVQSTVTEQGRVVRSITQKINATAQTTQATAPQTTPVTLSGVRSVTTTTVRPQPQQRIARRDPKLPPLPTRVVRRAIQQPPNTVTTAATGSPQRPKILNTGGGATTGLTTGSIPTRQSPAQPRAQRPLVPTTTQPVAPPQRQSAAPVEFGSTTIINKPASRAAVQLARALSLDELRATWEGLVSNHPALLGGLQPRYSQDRQGAYLLLAGPLDDQSMAGRLCQALQASSVACGVNAFTGNAL